MYILYLLPSTVAASTITTEFRLEISSRSKGFTSSASILLLLPTRWHSWFINIHLQCGRDNLSRQGQVLTQVINTLLGQIVVVVVPVEGFLFSKSITCTRLF